jgi:hypothetical protein
LVIALVIVAVFARALPTPRNVDDSYITFRYSRHLVEGNGFVYNVGERVLGTTTPLYALLMAAISRLTGREDYPWYALTVNAAADAGTCVLLFLILRRATGSRWAGALIGGMWAVSPMSVTFAIGGMETSVAILWMVAAHEAYLRGRAVWVGVLAALGLLTRIDALIWIGPLFALQALEGSPFARLIFRPARGGSQGRAWRLPWRTWGTFVLVLAPWLAFSTLYFGSPVPQTVAAKASVYVLQPGSAASFMLGRMATPFSEWDTFGGGGAVVSFAVYTALSLLGVWVVLRRVPHLLPFVAYPFLYFAAFAIANPLIFRWYLAPPIPPLMVVIMLGVWAFLGRAPRLQPVILSALAVVWGFTSINAWTLRPDHGPDRPAPRMAWHQIELYYEQMARALVDQYGVGPQTVIAAGDIGAVGYFTRAQIIDSIGLVTPAAMRYYPIPAEMVVGGQNFAVAPGLILDTKPDFLVVMEAHVRLGLEQDADFKRLYGDPILRIPTDFYGTDMRVYQRGP